MEYSTDPHQQQYYHHYQQQQTAYDPSHYHQSMAYYAYADQQHYDRHQYQYYPPHDSYTQMQYHQFHQETASIQPPGVTMPPDPAHFQNQQNVYYQTQAPVEGQQQPEVNPGSGAESGGFNPTAATSVPALSQVMNFAGNMDGAQRPMLLPQMKSAHRGGRSGGRAFRGGGRGHFGHLGPRYDGSGPSHNRGRGQGRGRGGRHFPMHGVALATTNSMPAPSEDAAATSVPPAALVPGQVPAATVCPPQRMAWCELCRVNCNTPEILEQHKNGKRHKKNLQMHEQSQKQNKEVTVEQNVQPIPNSGSKVVQAEEVEGSKEKQSQQEGLTSLAAANDNTEEPEQQKDMGENSVASTVDSAEAKGKSRDQFEPGVHGFKRKMKGGGGGKYIRTNQGARRTVKPPKQKEVIPFICELCNVKCESQVVFNSHLTGKKHVANLKKFQAHRALYGEEGHQALYPPNYSSPSASFNPQVQQGTADPQVVLAQLLTYVLTQAQAPGLVTPQIPLTAASLASIQASLANMETQNQYPHYQQNQDSLVISEAGSKNAVLAEPESQQQSITVSDEAPEPTRTDTRAEDDKSESEKTALGLPQYNSAMAPSENPAIGVAKLLSPTKLNKDAVAPESQAVESVTNNDIEEPESAEEDPEEESEEPEEDPEEETIT
ncbi:hypothetical protein SLA2020_137590 [Shorea laevis]